MAISPSKDAIAKFESLLQTTRLSSQREAAIEEIVDRLPPSDAKQVLLSLLDRHGINVPELSGYARANAGVPLPDAWRTKALALLCDRLCRAEEAIALLDHITRHDERPDHRFEALLTLAQRFGDCREAIESALFCQTNGMDRLARRIVIEHLPQHPEAWIFLIDSLRNNDHLARLAFEGLNRYHAENPKTSIYLDDLALNGPWPRLGSPSGNGNLAPRNTADLQTGLQDDPNKNVCVSEAGTSKSEQGPGIRDRLLGSILSLLGGYYLAGLVCALSLLAYGYLTGRLAWP